MSDWIREKADQIKRRQEQAEEERQSDAHEVDVIHRRGREVLEQLEVAVRADVQEWNANFPSDARQRIDSVGRSTPNGFVVLKTGYPTATLHAVFDPSSMSIQFRVAKLRAIHEGEYNVKGLFNLNLSEDGAIYLTNRSGELLSFEEASRHLLEAILDT
jgi:hypothetical protein